MQKLIEMTGMMATETDQELSTIAVARQLGLAVRSVQLMVDRGELEAWKTPGGHRRISRSSVERWQQQQPRAGGAAAQTAPAPAVAVAVGANASSTTLPRPSGDVYRILLIEDSVHFQNLVSLVIKHSLPNADLHIASDGISGLAMAGQLQPYLLLVDILLPGIDGATLISGLRMSPQFKDVKLIVVTSLKDEELAPYRFALKGVPVIHKSRVAMDLPALLPSFDHA